MNSVLGSRRLIVGVDLDNTVVIYDELFRGMAAELGLLPADGDASKREVRDAVRRLPGGEILWQKLQAAAYGPRIGAARLADGLDGFLKRCHSASAAVYVISHKTQQAGYDETGTNLRQAALEWMTVQGLFGPRGLRPEDVYFGETRQEKLAYIRKLGCTHFVDDLEETFQEEGFPAGVEQILYAPRPTPCTLPGVRRAVSWQQVGEYLFDVGSGPSETRP